MATTDPNFHVIQIHHHHNNTTNYNSSLNSNKRLFPIFNLIIRSPAFISILITLSTSMINTLFFIHTTTSTFYEYCLPFLLIVSANCAFTHLFVNALVYYIERCFAINNNKTLYFVFALKTSVEYLFSSSSILLSSWFLLISKSDHDDASTVFLTSTLATFVFAAALWTFKIVILKVLECGFHDKHFFHNMQSFISREYLLQTLLKPTTGSKAASEEYSTMRGYLKWIKYAFVSRPLHVCTRPHTICDALSIANHNNVDDDENLQLQVDNVITMVFKNLTNNQHRDIEETDLLWVMKEEDIANVLQLFEGAAETKSISESCFRKWTVKVCNERKLVVSLLNSSSNVMEQLNKIVVVNLSFLVALVWCLLMGFGTVKLLVYITSHLLVLVFMFGNFCKTICEGIMLAVVLHPFDKGDHCIIDNEQLVVEEIGLINTVFLKDDDEKNVNYPNSVLLTKSISNLNRSSDFGDTTLALELLVSSTTSSQTIAALKLKIDELLGSYKPEQYWRADHCFNLKGIDNTTHKYNLQITYPTNFQNYKEKKYQRSELVVKLRKLLEDHELDIIKTSTVTI